MFRNISGSGKSAALNRFKLLMPMGIVLCGISLLVSFLILFDFPRWMILLAASALVAAALLTLFALQVSTKRLSQLTRETFLIGGGDVEVLNRSKSSMDVSELGAGLDLIRKKLSLSKEEVYALRALQQTTLKVVGDGVIEVNCAGFVTSMNESAEQQTGWALSEVTGHSLSNVFRICKYGSIQHDDQSLSGVAVEISLTARSKMKVQLIDKLGQSRPIYMQVEPVRGIRGDQIGAVIGFTDLSSYADLQTELDYQASHDNLTQLMNRREFDRKLNWALESAQQQSLDHVLCCIDIYQFKVINDSCGHLAGDELLRQVAQVFRRVIRLGDTIARLGGNEFGLLLERCSITQAERVTEQLLKAIEGFRFHWDDKTFSTGINIGIVAIDENTSQLVDVLIDASSACHLAKEAGRNRIHIYNKDDVRLTTHRQEVLWVDKIEKAIETNGFKLFIQKIEAINSSGNELNHFEVLLRLVDEHAELVSPGEFLPSAERFGLISQVDRWVTETTLQWLSDKPAILGSLKLCSINLSGQSLGDNTFLPFVTRQLDESQVPPELLCFEITETAAIANLSSAKLLINTLRSRGCRFALDDFGSGLSSFAYLKSLPVDFIKIDGLFVKDILDDPLDYAMVRSINEIGQLMGMRTIAEFVENDKIKARLQELGVDYVQGYGIDKPRPIEHLADICKPLAEADNSGGD
ncbi:MAG: EAL domain-containing protein [Granulosicoccus sp.]|nr:EAL domain-containing protein [Granulosicoccus sp.]